MQIAGLGAGGRTARVAALVALIPAIVASWLVRDHD